MRFPSDRRFVDKDGKIMDHWLGPLKRLERLINLTDEQLAALLALLGTEEGGEGGTLNLALPITENFLFSEDWAIIYRNSENAAFRLPLSFLEPAAQRTLISTTSLTGSSVSIDVPAGYTDLELRLKDASVNNTAKIHIQFSEDGGGTFLNQNWVLYSDSFDNSGVADNDGEFTPFSIAAAGTLWGRMLVFGYAGATDKFTQESYITEGFIGDTEGAGGGRVIESTAAINSITVHTSANNFDAGAVELWGIP